jgi:DNA topoisomerase-2
MKIKKIQKVKLPEKKKFLDITVDEFHNFVIGDSRILTHNTSLNTAIVGMAQTFKNSMPLLEGIGQFGSLRSPEAGAPRYISTKLNGNFRLLYKDFELLESQIEEGSEIEPQFFLPIIPTVLLNGSSGIAVGFATNILNRNAVDLIDACLKILDGKKFTEPLPWWSEFNGPVQKVDGSDSSFAIRGVHRVVNSTTVEITELPPSMTFQKYENHLNSLLEKGHITAYDDNCSKGINYIVKFNRVALQSRIEKGQLEGLLKLIEAETENLTCLDEHGKLIIFKNVNDLIQYFVKFRLSFYDKRKTYILTQLNDRNLLLSNRARFIKSIIDNKLKLSNRPKQDIVIDLQKMKFDQIESSYDYLLTMSIQSLTKEKYEALLHEVSVNENEIKKIQSIEPIEMYRSDLKDLRKKIAK